MLYISYISRAVVEADQRSVEYASIRGSAAARNTALAITGALVCTGGYFVGLLEGPEAAVEMVFSRVVTDPRHRDIRVIDRDHRIARLCGAWRMVQFE